MSLKDKRETTFTNVFKNVLNGSRSKASKILADKDREFDNRSKKSVLKNNNVEIYLIHSKGRSVIVKRFIEILKNKIY